MKFYTLDKLLSEPAHYYISFSKRGIGKTFDSLVKGLTFSYNNKKQHKFDDKFGYLRRYDIDLQGKGKTIFKGLVRNNKVEEITNGDYKVIDNFSQDWFFYNEQKHKDGSITLKKEREPICFGLSLQDQEHLKSADLLDINTLIFDEFISRKGYKQNEVSEFLNLVSTVKRGKGLGEFRVIMLANTVSWECPYFHSFGIYEDVLQMKPGEIKRITKVDEEGTETIYAIEYADTEEDVKDGFFANVNARTSKMITKGVWETDEYSILSKEERRKLRPKNYNYTFYIKVYNELFEASVIRAYNKFYLYIHEPEIPIKEEEIPKTKIITKKAIIKSMKNLFIIPFLTRFINCSSNNI